MENRVEVVVKDVQIPFVSMVVLMVKWSLAAIPALILIGIVMSIIASVLAGFGATFPK